MLRSSRPYLALLCTLIAALSYLLAPYPSPAFAPAPAMKTVLVTGGAGYIGSHTVLELVNSGMTAVVVDNLDNSSEESLRRVAKLTGKPEAIIFRLVDLCDRPAVEAVFAEFKFDACIHFAGLKAVGESVQMPLQYYRNNLMSTIVLLETMEKNNCRNFVFSSSATVYGLAKKMPVTEETEINSTNPYGRTKLFIEEFLRDLFKSNPKWNILILRYFNPCGAHESGMVSGVLRIVSRTEAIRRTEACPTKHANL
jgi:UDP-glucose 4-epimerase